LITATDFARNPNTVAIEIITKRVKAEVPFADFS